MLITENSTLRDRIPSTPPVIVPVPSQLQRPLWSVMIPTYNCLPYLQETIESVLVQDPGTKLMQIAVIDDCSTDGDVFALVQKVGKNRVAYFRQVRNVGSLRNFETCLNHSIGQWVHLLHGDDQVAPGFYTEIAALFTQYPEAGAALTNTAYLREGEKEAIVKAPIAKESGLLKDFLLQVAEGQKTEPPAVVVKRSVYEQLGSFFAVHYGEDWEMWARIAAHFPVAYSPKCLARYRYLGESSITHGSFTRGDNAQDIFKVIDIIQGYLPLNQRNRLKKDALRGYALYCGYLANDLYNTDPETALVQAKNALAMSKHIKVLYLLSRFYLRIMSRAIRF